MSKNFIDRHVKQYEVVYFLPICLRFDAELFGISQVKPWRLLTWESRRRNDGKDWRDKQGNSNSRRSGATERGVEWHARWTLKCYDVDCRGKRHRRHARLGCSVICINGPSTPENSSCSGSGRLPPWSSDWLITDHCHRQRSPPRPRPSLHNENSQTTLDTWSIIHRAQFAGNTLWWRQNLFSCGFWSKNKPWRITSYVDPET